MNKYSRILIIINLLLLLGYFNWAVREKEQTLANGKLILMRLAPADPRSIMQGDYMKLYYEESNTELVDSTTLDQGFAILQTDYFNVGKIVRLQKSIRPLNEGEIALKYKYSRYDGLVFGSENYFFEEGQGDIYEKAVYGAYKIDDMGDCLLIGLYDKDYLQLSSRR